MLLVPLLYLLGLERPVEAKKITLSCVANMTYGCLRAAIQAANDDYSLHPNSGNQFDIFLGNGPIRLEDSLTVTTPNWLQIFGLGSGLTSIRGSCFPPKGVEEINFYENHLTEADFFNFYKSPQNLAECRNVTNFSALKVKPGAVLVLDSLSIGNAQCCLDGDDGGGIRNEGTLLVYRSSIMHNHTHGSGGGIYHNGPWLYLQDTMVNNNIAHNGAGGGIFIAGGRVDIWYSTIHSNWTPPQFSSVGGGIVNGGTNDKGEPFGGKLYITNSTISKNIDASNLEQVNNKAGGIIQLGTGEVWLKSVTITDNYVASAEKNDLAPYSYGHGIFGITRFYFANSIIANNGINGGRFYPQCGGIVITLGGNLVGTNSGCYIVPPETYITPPDNWPKPRAGDLIGDHNASDFNKRNIDPLFETGGPNLQPLLRDHGGNTCTVALKSGSPARNNAWAGEPGAHVFACETWDQRWVKRDLWIKGKCDIGAYEYGYTPALIGVGCPDDDERNGD
jgi:hypothetical protein